jgi:hypothetical protein
MLLYAVNLQAQKTAEEINHLVDVTPYFDFRVDYKSKLILPDSIKHKLLIKFC